MGFLVLLFYLLLASSNGGFRQSLFILDLVTSFLRFLLGSLLTLVI